METEDMNMDIISARHAVRRYRETAIPEEILKTLKDAAETADKEGNLHIQLVTDEPRAFSGTMASYGKFSGVRNYFIMAGKKSDDLDERIGYYGEQLVLLAQKLGLNTCWVGLTYKKVSDAYELGNGEKVVCCIAVGYGETQGVSHKTKTPEEVSNVSGSTPDWFRKGVEAALLAPSAINQQKFYIEYLEKESGTLPRVSIRTKGISLAGYTQLDKGIARLHFEIGAGKENFVWA